MKGKQDLDFTTDEEKEAVREIFEGALSGEPCPNVPEPRLNCSLSPLGHSSMHCGIIHVLSCLGPPVSDALWGSCGYVGPGHTACPFSAAVTSQLDLRAEKLLALELLWPALWGTLLVSTAA